MSIEHVAKLGRSSLLNPSCPPVSSDAEHAKKHELVRAQCYRQRKAETELTNYARLKKPAIGQVHAHLTAERSLRADAKNIADDEHPDHQHRIDRGPTEPRIIRCQLGMHPT
jgi:hypothetical protein